jgi:hypothetical protein
MLQQRRRLSGKSTLGKALQYALSRWDALVRYVEDGRLSIDTDVFDKPSRMPLSAKEDCCVDGTTAALSAARRGQAP